MGTIPAPPASLPAPPPPGATPAATPAEPFSGRLGRWRYNRIRTKVAKIYAEADRIDNKLQAKKRLLKNAQDQLRQNEVQRTDATLNHERKVRSERSRMKAEGRSDSYINKKLRQMDRTFQKSQRAANKSARLMDKNIKKLQPQVDGLRANRNALDGHKRNLRNWNEGGRKGKQPKRPKLKRIK